MAPRRLFNHDHCQPGRALRLALLALALPVAACTQINPLMRGQPVAVVAVTRSTQAPANRHKRDASTRTRSLTRIINDDLQHGHFAEGRRDLRRYLEEHPHDAMARSMLRQLTADPKQMLGTQWTTHEVQPGDSYSTLADHYLGDANLFLILARYNGSTNPSVLQVGDRLRMPTAMKARTAAASDDAPASNDIPTTQQTADAGDSPAAKARRLQASGLTLMEQGHKAQALAKLDQALKLDPKLKPSGPKAVKLRQQLISSYHERAIVLYRDQKLDQAITLWDRVLSIDPDYEPAVVYRARARELQRRLKQL